MILADGKQIQGIFIYDESAQYTLGDFIIESDCMYICKSGSPVSSKLPSENPDYFSAYPGEMVADIKEYKEYISDPTTKVDKYISASVLSGILQEAYTGFGDTGVIEDYLLFNGEGEIDACLRGQKINLGKDRALDVVMRQEDLNNAYLVVDRNLSELSNILVHESVSEEQPTITPFDLHQCILRQYTYQDFSNLGKYEDSGVHIEYRYRVQELLDYKNSQIFYRYTVGSLSTLDSVWNYDSVISDWKCTSVNPGLVAKMNEILNYYNREMTESVEAEENSPTSNTSIKRFNFGESVINKNENLYTVDLLLDTATSTVGAKLPISDFNSSFPISVIITVPLSNSVGRSYSLSFDLIDTPENGGVYYYLSENLSLFVERSQTADFDSCIRLTVRDVTGGGESYYGNATIKNIYFRYYE